MDVDQSSQPDNAITEQAPNSSQSSQPAENHDSETFETIVDLVLDDFRAGQLGSPLYKNNDPLRELVTAKEDRSLYYFAIKRLPVQWILLPDSKTPHQIPAALITLVCTFQQLSNNARFRKANITVDFRDGATAHINPHDQKPDEKHQPLVETFEPTYVEGIITQRIGKTSLGLSPSIGDPMNIAKVEIPISLETPMVKESAFRIHGKQRRDPASGVVWSILENDVRKTGICHELAVCLVVRCIPGRRFIGTVHVNADIKGKVLTAVAGKNDIPLSFLPPADIAHYNPSDLAILDRYKGFESVKGSGEGIREVIAKPT